MAKANEPGTVAKANEPGTAPEAPLFRGMLTGPDAFLEMPGACGLRPGAWTHLKKTLCHTRPVGGTEDSAHFP